MWQIPRGQFTRDVAIRFLMQGVLLGISLVSGAVTARWLGPDGKGLLGLTTLLPSFIALLLGAGLTSANVFFASNGRLSLRALTSNSVAAVILVTFLGVGLVLVLLATGAIERIVPNCPIELILIGLCLLPLSMFTSQMSCLLQGLRRIKTLAALSVIQQIAGLGLILFLIVYLGLGVMGALVAGILGAALAVVLNTRAVLKEGGTLRPRLDPAVVKTTLGYGIKNHVGNLLQYFNYRLDVFIVNIFLGPAEVGIYGVSVVLAEMLWFLPDAVSFVIFPKAAATSAKEMNDFTPRVFKIVLGISVIGGIGLALVSKPLIPLIFSDAFAPSYMPLLVLLPGVVLLGGAKVLNNEIAGRGHPEYNSINAGICLVITVVSDLLMIPQYGVVGAAAASSLAYAATFFIALGFYRKVSRKAAAA
jgi:O-antigen/teichoic acid export membrane protein